MSAEIRIYNPDELGPPMGQYSHVTRVKASEFRFSSEDATEGLCWRMSQALFRSRQRNSGAARRNKNEL